MHACNESVSAGKKRSATTEMKLSSLLLTEQAVPQRPSKQPERSRALQRSRTDASNICSPIVSSRNVRSTLPLPLTSV